jgi:hypothetical protein
MGSFYKIFNIDENSIYERNETNYIKINVKDFTANNLIAPSTVSISIYDPCDTPVVVSASMVSFSTGVYFYPYNIAVDALFGEYEIEVTTTSPTYKTIWKDKFYILPWNAIYDVRRITGITSKKSISDHDFASVIFEAYKEALEDVYESHHDCKLKTGLDSFCEYINGTNVSFETCNSPLADHDGDGQIYGYGENSCATDIGVLYKDEDGDCHEAWVEVLDAKCGKIKVTTDGTTPLAKTTKWVHPYYWKEDETYNATLFKRAVCFLAAYKCILRFQELDKATQADLDSNRRMMNDNADRVLKEYKNIIRMISRLPIGGAMFNEE